MRVLVPVIVLSALSLAACGGRFDPDDGCPDDRCADGGFDTTPDTSVDGDTTPDTPVTCGSGSCTPGTSCRLDCNNCYCSPSGVWGCTAMACLDSGPDIAPDSGPTCPATEPIEGTPCAGPGTGPLKCGYTNACGGYDTAICDPSVSFAWKIYRGDCPPPPPPACPTKKPAAFSACSGSANCAWDNGCGAVTFGYCDGKSWNMKETPCAPGCPGTKPAGGAACKPAPSCSYVTVPGTTCTSSCFCADDGRWACVTPPCAGTGGGSVPPGG